MCHTSETDHYLLTPSDIALIEQLWVEKGIISAARDVAWAEYQRCVKALRPLSVEAIAEKFEVDKGAVRRALESTKRPIVHRTSTQTTK